MIKKKIIIFFAVLLVILFIYNVGFCESKNKNIQYENYEWGMKKSVVKRLISEKSYKITQEKKYLLKYNEMFFLSKVHVEMYFTPKTKKLALIRLIGENTTSKSDMLNPLKNILIEMYGSWKDNNGNEIELSYESKSNITKCTYFSKKYSKKLKIEMKEILKNKL